MLLFIGLLTGIISGITSALAEAGTAIGTSLGLTAGAEAGLGAGGGAIAGQAATPLVGGALGEGFGASLPGILGPAGPASLSSAPGSAAGAGLGMASPEALAQAGGALASEKSMALALNPASETMLGNIPELGVTQGVVVNPQGGQIIPGATEPFMGSGETARALAVSGGGGSGLGKFFKQAQNVSRATERREDQDQKITQERPVRQQPRRQQMNPEEQIRIIRALMLGLNEETGTKRGAFVSGGRGF